jgi:ribosomal-protein-alanine N-acetyltransferase
MWKPPVLETARLILRALTEEDQADIFTYANKPKISQYTLWEPHQSVADSVDYIKNYAEKYYQEGTPEPFGIIHKESNRLIGCVGAFWVSKPNKCMELAFVLSDDYWGQGITAEASQAVIDYCFKLFGIERLQCRCKAENKASFRVMEKLGMSFEGVLRSAIFHRQRYWDMKYCSLLKGDWKQSKISKAFIRRAEIGDEKGIHESHMKSIQDICSRDYTPEQIKAWGGRSFDEGYLQGLTLKEHVWVIEMNGQVEGHGLLTFSQNKKVAEVSGLYLTPKALGQGLGKEIIFYMKEICLIKDINEIKLLSTKTAKSFYEALGFRQNGSDTIYTISGIGVEAYPMSLKI